MNESEGTLMSTEFSHTTRKVLHFPIQASLHHRQFKNKRHWNKGQDINQGIVLQFIRALVQNDFPSVIKMVEEQGDHLATVHGNYFSLPLHIAGQHSNIEMMNYLLEKGADPYLAIHHPRFKYLFFKVKRYLKAICNFKHQILDNLEL